MWPYFYGTLQWESQYVEPLCSLVSINLWNNNLCNTDLSRLLCLFLYFLWSLSLQGERFSGGWRTGRKWSEVLRGGQFSGRSQEICFFFFFFYSYPFFPQKKRPQFTPKLSFPRCLRTPGVLAGHINISLSFLINLRLLPLSQTPHPQPVPSHAAPWADASPVMQEQGWAMGEGVDTICTDTVGQISFQQSRCSLVFPALFCSLWPVRRQFTYCNNVNVLIGVK